jgi:DNA-binding response OmpR family regulator
VSTAGLIADQPELIHHLKMQLKFRGYRDIQLACNGDYGYHLILKTRPFVVIVGIFTQRGEGLAVCERIRSNQQMRLLPVILLSRASSWEERFLATGCGVDTIMNLPVSLPTLCHTLHSFRLRYSPAGSIQPVIPVVGLEESLDLTSIREVPAATEPDFAIDLPV